MSRAFLNRSDVKNCHGEGAWQRIVFSEFSSLMESTEHPFPCIFGVRGYRGDQLRYVFHDSVDIRSLAISLGAFLRQARSFGPNTSLVLFTKPDRVLPLDVYRETFWSLLRELVRQDNRPWPDHIPVELRDPLWEFSFAGEPVFVICNTPAHLLRQSRRSSCFMVTFQPRWVFDKILEAVFELGFGHGMSKIVQFQEQRRRKG